MATGLAFDRSRSAYRRCLASDRFRADSATINSYFWMGHLADGGLRSAAKKLDDSDDPVSALSLPVSVYANSMPHDVATLRERMSTHTRWRRLLTLVMIASALERYLDAAARIAIASDPLLTSGFPKMLDGAVLKKHGLALPARNTQSLIVGPMIRMHSRRGPESSSRVQSVNLTSGFGTCSETSLGQQKVRTT